MATAKIKVLDALNRPHFLRCLIDPGSQSEYISAACSKRLSLPISTQSRYSKVQGIGGASQKILGVTSLKFTSRFEDGHEYHIQPMVVDNITSQLPDSRVDVSALRHIRNLPMADDDFSEPGPIDLLLGVNLYCQIILSNKIVANNILPAAIETTLGYIVMGNAPIISPHSSSHTFCAFTNDPLHQLVERFWSIEEPPSQLFLSPDDQRCEEIYTSTTTRNDDGSYVVQLPFKDDPQKLGNSFITAKKRFSCLEKKFLRSPGLHKKYNEIIADYLKKGILSRVSTDDCTSPGYYLPHHPVVRDEKSTTKVRIVLDGSASTDSGLSLNDILYKGCNLQADIFNILLNVRIHRIAFFADVRMMYLCIYTHPAHRCYQRILYRFSPHDALETFQFERVSFGLRSSPMLALRTLRQLAQDERHRWPIAADVITRDVYMDDLASSASSVDQAVKTAQELIQMFKAGGFDLVKWTSNSSELLEHIPITHRQSESISFDDDDTFKILGLRWLPASDNFIFLTSVPPSAITKRAILSMTARLYDVLGLVGPVILYAKLIIRELWLLHINWDDKLPCDITNLWQRYVSELPLISHLKFPRHVGIEENDSKISLVAFSDASEKAYGCVIYLHVSNGDQPPLVSLLCSKSRVASAKPTITLARLELNGLVLLAKLLRVVYDSLSARCHLDNIFIFSDSTVALCWVTSSPHKFHTYIANRISDFQTTSPSQNVYHVPGVENPADLVSRGLLPSQILNNDLWFHGPPWMSSPLADWPVEIFSPTQHQLPEEKTVSHITVVKEENLLITLGSKFSSWLKFLRSTVFVLRFLKVLPRNDVITAEDLGMAENKIIQSVQLSHFATDIRNIQKNTPCSTALRKLSPFISDGIARVGGRLSYSSLDYNQKHPALMPKNGHIAELIVDWYHRENSHAGPQLLMSILRQKYWFLSARRLVRNRIHKCVRCFRLNPKPTFPAMSDLPRCRVEPCKAFTHTGVDYAGPLYITTARKRGVRSQKAYICVFVCLVTKAVHIELASDLSSATFLDAFKRFLSRRGPCYFIYSDNGTNFIASQSFLKELFDFLKTDEYYQTFNNELSKHEITWKRSPPLGSHFGGIWEANIKGIKSLLFRVIGKQILTYEEMLTVLNQVEAVLNSRPLYVLSSDPSEPTALTPSHFLSTKPLAFLPAPDVSGERSNLLSRHSLMDSLVQTFWKRFKNEYLHNLQMREKWNTASNPLAVGDIVLLNNENAPPLSWKIGKISEVFPGRDGRVRCVRVDTCDSSYVRSTTKLSPLPIQ